MFLRLTILLGAFSASLLAERQMTLDEFLTYSPLGKTGKELEKTFELKPGSLAHPNSRLQLAKLPFGGLDFNVRLGLRDGICFDYALWRIQDSRLGKDGKLLHKEKANIDDVFEELAKALARRFGQAPRVIHPPRGELKTESPSFNWSNDKLALSLALHDNIGLKDILLSFTKKENLRFTGYLPKDRSPERDRLKNVK